MDCINVAINGFGRIGKIALNIIEELRISGKKIRVVAINSPSTNIDHIIYMLKYDSVYKSRYTSDITYFIKDGLEYINLNNTSANNILVHHCYSLADIDWGKSNVDIVIESSGAYKTINDAGEHLKQGAKKVIISAPSTDAPTFVYGVNHNNYDNTMKVISNASCTTNCLAPLVKVLNDNFIIEDALVSSVHSSTASQKIVDGSSKKDWRLGRSTLNNIIPTTTGAAKAVAQVIPELTGKITGLAYRIPIINGSLIDLTVRVKKIQIIKEIMNAIKNNNLDNTIEVTCDPIVSTDIIGNRLSCLVDSKAGIELNKNFYKIVAWYDNEYGYTSRLIDMIFHMMK